MRAAKDSPGGARAAAAWGGAVDLTHSPTLLAASKRPAAARDDDDGDGSDESGQPSPKPLGDANVPKSSPSARSEPKPKKQPKIDKFFAAQRAGDQACRSS